MGIVNATPDSFSDGGRYEPVAHALSLCAEGADVIDVGGESTRPGAAPVDEEEELRRVLPVVRAAVAAGGLVSIDTRRARVAAEALAAGARMVNDVSAAADPDMLRVVALAGASLVLMHMRGTPGTMSLHTQYADVVSEVWSLLARRAELATRAGCIDVWIDPGIGFAKTAPQSVAVLRSLTGRDNARVVIGASRKSFLGTLAYAPTPDDRLEGSLAVAIYCAALGVGMLRVHDIVATRKALCTWNALR
ncbi:MAG: dihydropteroate synthase [Myxococcales bacterium]|nr:dihydropteroate synthase [Myxococcales bacterium]